MKEYVGNVDNLLPVELENAGKKIIGAAIEVHRHLGPGLLESIYERALVHELGLQDMTVWQQHPITIDYKGVEIAGQRLDLLVDPGIIVELKSIESISTVHERQVVSYLKSTGYRLGYLINFNTSLLKNGIKRFVN